MISMTAKEYLKEISAMQHYLDRLKKRRKNLHLDVSFGGMNYSADRIQSSPKNKLEEAAVRMSDCLEYIDKEISRISVEIDDRIGSIEKLANDTHKDVLFKRYVEEKSFEQISKEMSYAYNYVCMLHGEALDEFAKVHNKS